MRTLVYIVGVLALAGCSGGSQFPEPTGKGTFRAINAVADSPTLEFRVENAGLSSRSPFFDSSLGFRGITAPFEIDDFEYEFNFDFRFPAEDDPRRLASQRQKIDADQDYTFILTGSMANPSITVLTAGEREFDAADTVFEVRFAHFAASLGRADVYLAAPGTAPVLGNARGTLSFGDILDPVDLPEGDYELILTAENDPATVLYQSINATYQPQARSILAVFDGTVDDAAPFLARALPMDVGDPLLTLPDARFGSTIRFVQASRDIAAADIFDDEMLTNLVVADHAYQDITDEFPLASGETPFSYTAAGNPGVVQFEATVLAGTGSRHTLYATGTGDDVSPVFVVDVRRPASPFARFALINTDASRETLRVYVLEPGATIDDPVVLLPATFRQFTNLSNLAPGDYEIVVTANDNDNLTPLAPAIPLTLGGGDVVRLIAFATADPAVLDIQPLP